jgi:hypothetical protein
VGFFLLNARIEDIAFIMRDTIDMIQDRYLHPTPMMLTDKVAKAMNWHCVSNKHYHLDIKKCPVKEGKLCIDRKELT